MARILQGKIEDPAAELDLILDETESGRSFEFILKHNHISVKQVDIHGYDASYAARMQPDYEWYDKLTEQERLLIFNRILAKYRERSLSDPPIAALGVTENNDLYIGTNTERLSSSYFRQCAEQNMVTAVTQADVEQQIIKNARNPKTGKVAFTPHEPKLKSLYMMGGRETEKKDENGRTLKPIRLLCPCGNCTDMLAKVMNEGAPVYMLPVNSGTSVPEMKLGNNILEIIEQGDNVGWKANIEQLNHGRVINLNVTNPDSNGYGKKIPLRKEMIAGQKQSFRDMLKLRTVLPEELASEVATELLASNENKKDGKVGFNNLLEVLTYAKNQSFAMIAKLPKQFIDDAHYLVATAVKAAENAMLLRHSVPELDAMIKDNHIDESDLYHFMYQQNQRTFADRLTKLEDEQGRPAKDLSDTQLLNLVKKQIASIRCVVIQLDDGTFRYAVESDVKGLDKAAPCGEMVAVASAMSKLGRQGVRHVWTQDMCPEAIIKGMIQTPTKEGSERIVKRRSKLPGENVTFHVLPFIDGAGKDDATLRQMMLNFTGLEIFPSYFSGVENSALNQAGSGRG